MMFRSWILTAVGSAADVHRANGGFIAIYSGPEMKSAPSFIRILRRRRASPAPAVAFLHFTIWSRVAGGPDIRCAPYRTFGTQELSDAAVAASKVVKRVCSPITASSQRVRIFRPR